jgi:hypothetical protein
LCDPAVSVDVLKVAVPVGSGVPVPRVVAPCLKTTVPVGMPLPELTVAVKVTVCPTLDRFCEEVSVVVVAALLIFCVRVLELAAKEASPL